MKKMILSAAAAALLVLSFGLSKASHAKPAASEQGNSSDKYQIKIDNFSFAPATLTVPVGTTVTWVNQDDVPHNIRSSEGNILRSPVMDTDQKFSYTFTKAGTYLITAGSTPR